MTNPSLRFFALLSLGATVLLTSACDPCRVDGAITVCGDFGAAQYAVELPSWDSAVQWPPVATEDGRLLLATDRGMLALDPSGAQTVLGGATGINTAVPSMDDDGLLFAAQTDAGGLSYVLAVEQKRGGERLWWTPVSGTVSVPPAIGQGTVFVTVGDGPDTSLLTIDVADGDVLRTREDATGPVTDEAGNVRYLEGSMDCGASHAALVAEDAEGTEQWRYEDASGIVDFAPGPDGASYVVTGDRRLMRLSADGTEEWSFEAPCDTCNVAAAPTVTEDSVYFPVWEGWSPRSGCDDGWGDPNGVDPLYVLKHDGTTRWIYDGFDTTQTSFNPAFPFTAPFGGSPIETETVRHHPAGRPTVANDGTLYVSADGAVVALDAEGNEIGRAIWDEEAGETTTHGGGIFGSSSSWINRGVTPSPVLGPDGTLYVWDGDSVRAFQTSKPAANLPWTAPFGGFHNAGRVGG